MWPILGLSKLSQRYDSLVKSSCFDHQFILIAFWEYVTGTLVFSSVSFSCNFCWTSCNFSPFSRSEFSSLCFSSSNPCKNEAKCLGSSKLDTLSLTFRLCRKQKLWLKIYCFEIYSFKVMHKKKIHLYIISSINPTISSINPTWDKDLASCNCLCKASIFSWLSLVCVCRFCSVADSSPVKHSEIEWKTVTIKCNTITYQHHSLVE